MTEREPVTTLQPQFSTPDVAPTPWSEARERLDQARIYWVVTVRPDGRPHVTPLYAVWLEGTLYFCTGEQERKAKNLAQNAHCVILTGCNTVEGLDVVLEGDAAIVRDEALLQRVAAQYASKYDWHFAIRDGVFVGEGGNPAMVLAVTPSIAFGFGKGDAFSQTRWRF